ncbi:tRNA (adenosine(37)-N6)-threonylcarbamoyltransferase complex dimerization subunit type 1 TsaB [Ferrovibrio sp.]|uniref:tRNA (adenosine(37)-N6)-threonylcarbamoyltransferase complex dimerization subunit type 1 TsaB n=1 Tax=Ferrovibrio sp. TaxID=1917215 RepID=UPI003D10574D
MKWLLLDTALDDCLAAIADGDAILTEQRGLGGKGHAERLLPTIEAARQAAGLELKELEAIAVTIGPGSFTGIRTALSVARGLSLALRKPLWGVTTTEALGLQAAQAGRATVAVIDARRGEVYLQAFAASTAGSGAAQLGIPLWPACILPLDQAEAILPAGPLTLVGSGAALLRPQPERSIAACPSQPTAQSLLQAARQAAGHWQPGDARPVPPKPLYIRPPDAALPRVVQPAASLSVTIQPADASHAAILSAMHREGFHDGWSEAALRDLLGMPGAFVLLAIDPAGQPAGFAFGRVAADEAEVITITVRPRLRQLGIGAALLKALAAEAKRRGAGSLFLEVAVSNLAAQALYRAGGFQQVGRRKDYYQLERISPDAALRFEDGLVMRAEIH